MCSSAMARAFQNSIQIKSVKECTLNSKETTSAKLYIYYYNKWNQKIQENFTFIVEEVSVFVEIEIRA